MNGETRSANGAVGRLVRSCARLMPRAHRGTGVASPDTDLNGPMRVRLTKRHRWMIVAGAASMAAAPLAERALAAAWRRVSGEEPPLDGEEHDVDWGRAVAWAASSALVVAVAQTVARRGAGAVWTQVTGSRPPRRTPRSRRVA